MSSIGRHQKNTSVTRWADRHGLIPELLPLAKRRTDSIELAAEAATAIEDMPETASSFKVNEVLPEARGYTATILRALGSWPYPRDQGRRRWVNPNYLHKNALGSVVDDETDRMDVIQRCGRLGLLSMGDVAPRLEGSESSIHDWLRRRDEQWSAFRRAGQKRFARTMLTAMEWGYTQQEVASIWLVPTGTVNTWIQRYARDTEFEPPADPTTDAGSTEVWG